MPRHRTIRPNFSQSAAVGRLSREARLLFIQMWTLVDDSGRLRWDAQALLEQLYPSDDDAPLLLANWLGELEREGFVELYNVDGVDYLRIPQWRRLQTIQHPSPSKLPAAPHETHETHESHEESPQTPIRRASKADPHEEVLFLEEEAIRLGRDTPFPPSLVRGYLQHAVNQAIASNVHTAAARHIELMGRDAGMWRGQGAPVGRKELAVSIDQIGLSPDELLPRDSGT